MTRLRPLLLVLTVIALVVAGCGRGPSRQEAPRTGAAYVALGDSYTAGAGILPTTDRPCGRSRVNYPSLVAKALKVSTFADRSCNGATTAQLQEDQTYAYTRLNDPQLDAVGPSTTLVTIGLGLNDDALSMGLLLVCLTPLGRPPTDKCQSYLDTPLTTVEAQMKVAADHVQAAVEKVRELAPRARIVVVGYPRLVPDSGSCPDRLPVPDAQVERMRVGMAYLDQSWAAAADAAGATYVDMYSASEGHDICSADPWVAGYKGVPGKAQPMHPLASYHQAVAARVEAVVTTGSAGS
ncbi:MAG TPA: SGNH/GDSL hydrolase family protein [Marmoricola sp.]|jgi:lysophospholipase L1-like esterase